MRYTIEHCLGNCHVGESYGRARWHVLNKVGGWKVFKSWPRDKRRHFLLTVARVHLNNRKLYRDVMGPGYLSQASAWREAMRTLGAS
jgi:hypothetical protein